MKKTKIKTVKVEDAIQQEKEKKKIEKVEEKKKTQTLIEKDEKKNNIFKELWAFLILVLIIGVISFGGWYWYTHIYNGDREIPSVKEEKNEAGYKAIKYTAATDNTLDVINEKYVVEYKRNKLLKVMDMKTDVLYEGEDEFDEIIEGIDNNLYLIRYDDADYENIVSILKLEDNEFKSVKKLSKSGIYYKAIKYKNKNNNQYYLVGFTGYTEGYNEENEYIYQSYIYDIKGEEFVLDNNVLFGDLYNTEEDDIVTYNDRYVVVAATQNGSRFKQFGLYDLNDKQLVITPQYEGLYTDSVDTYIAIKNGKSGIINNKLKKIVDFEYDFIDRNDDFYIVSKNNKMAIMDNNYNVVSKFDFDYQATAEKKVYNYLPSKDEYNTFFAKKVNDYYVLTINNKELESNIVYDKHETYIINSDGTYKIINANEFVLDDYSSLIYSYDNDKKTYTFYDTSFDVRCSINVSDYDYSKRPLVKLLNENTISIWFDSYVYFDYETGEEIKEMKDYSSTLNGIVINYNAKLKKLTYQVEGKDVASIEIDNESLYNNKNKYLKELDDNKMFYLTKKEYVYIEKGE